MPDSMRADSLDWRAPTLAESSAWEAAMYQAGLAGMTWPKAYGGHGLTLREHLAVNKEIGALPMPESVSSIGKELAGQNIAVNCVTPAVAKTPGAMEQSPQHIEYMLARIPRGRMLELGEAASMICWLSTEENSFTTGAVFDLSGGRATY